MTDTINVRDHSQPCEHEGRSYWEGTRTEKVYQCTVAHCPGGKEIILRQAPIIDSYRTYDIPQYIEAKVYIGQVLNQKYLWVEVDGNEV